MNDKQDVEMIVKYLPTTTPQYLQEISNLKYSWWDTVLIRLMRSSGVRIIFTVFCIFDVGVGTKFTELFDDYVQNKQSFLLNWVSFVCITVKRDEEIFEDLPVYPFCNWESWKALKYKTWK